MTLPLLKRLGSTILSVIRKISVQQQCLLCQSDCKSVSYLAKGCSFVQQVLSELGFFTCPWLPEQTFASWLYSTFGFLNSTAHRNFVVALWAIWASTIPNPYVMNPKMVEAIACEQALILSKELGFKHIKVEGDALLVISKLVNHVEVGSTLGAFYSNIPEKRGDFDFLSFLHVYQNRSNATHVLVIMGKLNPQVTV
ncbi:hypothetical protein V6N11_019132 [Hibiscus sabdariffa]|uniref:RNase H type-1 domain-containing protein n=1 Tax=Hibiscus sabdariffa TaxID=183260 RepID=A0ABR2R231_9ROSI